MDDHPQQRLRRRTRRPAGSARGDRPCLQHHVGRGIDLGRDLRQTAAAAGVEPRLVHIASDFIAACLPEWSGTLLGDKSGSAVFDTTKIKRFVPDFRTATPYAEGIRRTVAWFDADPSRQEIDTEMDARWDRLIAAYEQGLANAMKVFAPGT